MTILSYKTIFGPTFSAILEKIVGADFPQVPKNCDFEPKCPFFGTFSQIWAKCKFFSKKGLCYLFTLIVPQLHAKFRKNPWSGFRYQLRNGSTDGGTEKGDIIESVALAGLK